MVSCYVPNVPYSQCRKKIEKKNRDSLMLLFSLTRYVFSSLFKFYHKTCDIIIKIQIKIPNCKEMCIAEYL